MENQRPNIIWFMIDSLRNEFLHEFGNVTSERTFLDELLSNCISFTNCRSAAPYTIASLAAKMTGCYPSVNRIDGWLKENPLETLNPKCLTIIDLIKYHGYETTYMASSSSCAYIQPDSFDHYVCCDNSDNFFLNNIKESSLPQFSIMLLDIIHDDCCENIGKFDSAMYCNSIQKVSNLVERYYKTIKSENDILLITSDHGVRVIDELQNTIYSEEWVTGRYLTEKTTRCSFNIKWDGRLKPQKISNMVRSIDIFPTLMDILGWEYPRLDGVSLLPLIKGENTPCIEYACTLTGWSEMDPQSPGVWSIIDSNNFKLVVSKRYRGVLKRNIVLELFDLTNDLNEENDVSAVFPDLAGRLYTELNSKLMKVRDIDYLYAQTNFEYKKYLDHKLANGSSSSKKIANEIIVNHWQKVVRKRFLRNLYWRKFKKLIKYYLLGYKLSY